MSDMRSLIRWVKIPVQLARDFALKSEATHCFRSAKWHYWERKNEKYSALSLINRQSPPGEPGRYSACVRWAFNAQQLADFAIVSELIAAIDSDDGQDILLQAWEQALSLIHDDATWEAIEFFAPLIDASELDAVDIDYRAVE
jgi:hypothetical protein